MHSLPQRRSLVCETADVLREQINAGVWHDVLPGERELSGRLLVSRPTLRAALELLRREGTVDVSHGRKRRVCPTKRRVVAVPKRVALLSPLPPHRLPPFVMFWVDELRQHLADEGFDLEMHVSPVAHQQKPEKQLERIVAEVPAAAWVLFLSNEPMQRWFIEKGLPCVVAGSRFPHVSLPSVDIDSRAICRHAAGLFLAKKHRHIALLLPEGGTAGDQASEEGFLEGAKGSTNVRATVLRHDGTISGVCRKVEAITRGASPVTGLIVARSAHALTAFTSLQRRKFDIPNQLSFISRDSDAFLDFVVPQITRYSCNPANFARRVSRIALQLAAEGQISPREVLLMPELIKGETLR